MQKNRIFLHSVKYKKMPSTKTLWEAGTREIFPAFMVSAGSKEERRNKAFAFAKSTFGLNGFVI